MKKNPSGIKEGENPHNFLEELKQFKNFGKNESDETAAKEWIKGAIKEIWQEAKFVMQEDIAVDWGRVGEACYTAYAAHFGQKRKSNPNVLYVEHLKHSAIRFIEKIQEEYKDRVRPFREKKVDMTEAFIKIILHDALEDFLRKNPSPESLSLYPQMMAYLEETYGKEVADDIALVATNFSKRPNTKLPKGLSRLDISRVDFLAQMLGVIETRDAINLLLKVAERQDNLKDAGNFPNVDRKALESANLAIACYAASMRTPAKRLFNDFFRFFFREKPELLKKFETYITDLQKQDEENFQSNLRPAIQQEVEKILGHSDFEIRHSPLPLWRINMAIMDHPAYQKRAKWESMPLIYRELLDEEKDTFHKLIKNKSLHRIVIITHLEHDANKIWETGLSSFCPILTKRFTKKLEPENALEFSGYKARRSIAQFRGPDGKLDEKHLEFKVVSREEYTDNEFGEAEYDDGPPKDTVTPKYSVASLERYINHLAAIFKEQEPSRWEILKKNLLNPLGADLSLMANDLRVAIRIITKERVEPFINTMGNKRPVEYWDDRFVL
ncbi:hypothetical protein JXA05_00730 [Candidatus Peregrinibacteria bacterium]|nr:hypothetical protein [Candidatus Peregrinibacteria bacterium]